MREADKTAPVVAAFNPDDATVREYDLADGRTLCIECSDAGLIGGHDFRLASVAVLRFERRIGLIIPGLSPVDERLPSWWELDAEAVKENKLLFCSLWNGMPVKDQISFLEKVVDPRLMQRAA